MANKLPELDYVKSLLDYDPDTGLFTWKVKRGRVTIGSPAGVDGRLGYRYITIDKRKYYAHRLAWYISTGEDPADLQVDHINHDPADNRIENLRLMDGSTNCRHRRREANDYSKRGNRYCSQITFRRKVYFLGTFDTAEEAQKVARAKREELLK